MRVRYSNVFILQMNILKSGVFSVPYVTGQAIDWISPSVNSFIQWLNMHWEPGTEPGGGDKKDNMTSVCSEALQVLWVPGVAFLLNREVSPEFPQMWGSQFLNWKSPGPIVMTWSPSVGRYIFCRVHPTKWCTECGRGPPSWVRSKS